jgi:tetratricopeptide (TPR) repeat protein
VSRGAPARALDDARLASALVPDDARLPRLRALAHVAAHRPEAALAELDAARARGRIEPRALALRARVLTLLGRRDEAIAAWDEALARAPDADGALERGRLLEAAGRVEEAIVGYRIQLDATGATAVRLALVAAAERAGDASLALEALGPLLHDDAAGHWGTWQAEILARAGRDREARAAFAHALARIDTQLARRPSAMRRVDRARALLGLGRIDEAIVECRRALTLAPDHALARETLARALRTQGAGR